MAKKEVINTIKTFIKHIKQNNIEVAKVFLFGSHCFELNHDNSDIDVAVISKDFGEDYFQDIKTLMKIARKIDLTLSPKPYSLEEYKMASQGDFLWQEIINKGQEIDLN